MKENDDRLIWKYIDDAATAEERSLVEKRQEDDPAFQAKLAERKELHRHLQETTPEQPSMRFARSVMEKLPDLYRRTIEPLVQPFWVKVFFGTLGTFLVAYFGLVAYFVRQQPLDSQDQVVTLTSRLGDAFASLPYQFFTIIGALSFGFLTLVLLDRYLKSRFGNKVDNG